MIKINGKEIDFVPGQSVKELLEGQGFEGGRIAVERNGDILPKRAYEQTMVEDQDVYEVVNFVGGG